MAPLGKLILRTAPIVGAAWPAVRISPLVEWMQAPLPISDGCSLLSMVSTVTHAPSTFGSVGKDSNPLIPETERETGGSGGGTVVVDAVDLAFRFLAFGILNHALSIDGSIDL